MKTILVIDDNNDILENTAELLELSNYRVVTAREGNAGMKIARSHKPDLILCDIIMPGSDGQQFFKMAKQDEIVKNIPIVIFSAGSGHEIQKELKSIADGVIKKPFSEQELLSVINDVLARSNGTIQVNSKT